MLRKSISLIIVCGILCSLLSGCFLLPVEEDILPPPLLEGEELKFTTYEVTYGDIQNKIQVTASFGAGTLYELYFSARGRVTEKNVRAMQMVEEGTVLCALETQELERKIEAAEIAVRQAELSLRQARNNGNRYSIDAAQLGLESAKNQLRYLQEDLEAQVIRAPISGLVYYVNPVAIGESIEPYETIVRIADPQTVQLYADGNTSSLFRLGMEVEVKVKERTFKAKVVQTPESAPDDYEVKNRVIFSVEDIDPAYVNVGGTANVSGILDERKHVLVVPRGYIHSLSGRKYVNLLIDGHKVERDIETGLDTPSGVEILSGLEEKDLVIIS
ncbi:MAG: HlyD family efflux transporter periplasmic adaptor subunit [Clostridia bacterium]|nr:HlyD family efflux transporter periplasmic adaptor subunit [Clostridia bacterium]